jgi:diphthamide biosynthesis methyltransferase
MLFILQKKQEDKKEKKIVLSHDETEKGDVIINSAEEENTVFLTVGDSMTANEGMKIFLELENKLGGNVFDEKSIVCVVARVSSPEPLVLAGAIKDLVDRDYGPPLHTLVIPGSLHFMEVEALRLLAQLPA